MTARITEMTHVPDCPSATPRLFLVDDNVTPERALNHASDLLRCIIATAGESTECSQGIARDLSLSVVHLAQMAKVLVDRSLDSLVSD